MGNYISGLIIISIISGLTSNLLSSFCGVKKYVNYYIALVAVICLISPIINAVNNIDGFKGDIKAYFNEIITQNEIDKSNDLILNTGVESIQNGIKSAVLQKYGFDSTEVIVNIEIDKSNIESIKIKGIEVILTGKASWTDVYEVQDYLNSIIGQGVTVIRR